MRGINKVVLIGNLGRDPEIHQLDDLNSMAKLSVATTETFRDKLGKQMSHTEWHTVILRKGLADIAKNNLRKGSLIYIEGKIRYKVWEDKNKNKRYSTEIHGDVLVMLEKRKDHIEMPNEQSLKENISNINSETNFNFLDDDPIDILPF